MLACIYTCTHVHVHLSSQNVHVYVHACVFSMAFKISCTIYTCTYTCMYMYTVHVCIRSHEVAREHVIPAKFKHGGRYVCLVYSL